MNLHPGYAEKLGLRKTRSYLTAYPAVYARKDVPFGSPSEFTGKRVAIIDKVFFSEQIVAQHGKGATALRVQNAKEGLRLVNKGQADFFLGVTLNAYLITKYQFFGLATQYVFYDYPIDAVMGTRSDWPELSSILDKGLSSFSKEEIEAIVAKWNYLPEQQHSSIELTPEERAWLSKKHTVRVRVANVEPFIFVRGGKLQGIAVDLLKLTSKRTGLQFRFIIPSPSFAEDLETIARHEGPDLIPTIMKTPERETFLSFTKDYSTSPTFIFTRDDSEFIRGMKNLSGKTVAVINAFVVHKYLEKNHPEINLLVFKNVEDSLKAVSSGKAFAFIGDLKFTPVRIARLGLHNLKIAAPSSLPDHVLAMATRNDWPELRSILNKGFESISEEEKTAIINKWTSIRVDYGIRPAYVVKWILVVAGGACCIIFFFAYWNRSLSKKVGDRTVELESSNKALSIEVAERTQTEHKLQEYQKRLKALASQLTISEEKERRRIAADLHDRIGQSLAMMRMQIASAQKSAPDAGLKTKLDDISRSLIQTVQDTRNIIYDLSPPQMNEVGLSAAISDWLEELIAKRHGLATELIVEGQKKKLDDDVRAILFRNVRELLTNTVKHARASKVTVRVEFGDMNLKVVVQDDGVGHNPDAFSENGESPSGFGLFSIQERMADLGGALEIESEPGKGCKAILTVPVEEGKKGRGRR